MYKIKSAISNPQKSFPEWCCDITCMNLPYMETSDTLLSRRKKKLHFMKNIKQKKYIIFIFNIKHSFVCPSHSTDQTRERGQDPFASMEPRDGFHRE